MNKYKITKEQYNYIKEYYSKLGNSVLNEEKDTIHGGKADNQTIEDLAKYWSEKDKHDYNKCLAHLKKQLEIGVKIESEHTDDPEKAKEIALDHLKEKKDYYTGKMPKNWAEKELEKEKIEENKDKNYPAYVITVRDESKTLFDLINYIKKIGNGGHGFNIIVDPNDSEYKKEFYWDGDGPDRIFDITYNKKENIEESINKKDFSTKEREELADKGEALPDGSFPIRNKQDLKDAIKSYGRAANKEEAKSWIKKRAKALNLGSEIPENW